MNLNESYLKCQQVFKKYSKSYYIGSHFFEYKKFQQICAFYTFLRIIDNIVDSDKNIHYKKYKVTIFKIKFLYLISDGYTNTEWFEYHDYILAINDTFKTLGINKNIITRFFRSMELDLMKFEYYTYRELLQYMDGSAAIVGEAMYLIMTQDNKVSRNYRTRKAAKKLGFAFQITNFLRDIKEDLAMNPSRIYFPKDEQIYYKTDLKESRDTDNSIKFIKDQISRNKNYYLAAEEGIKNLPVKYQPGIKIAKIMGEGILKNIEAHGYKVFNDKRNNLSKFQKIGILFNNLACLDLFRLTKNYISYNFL